MKFYSNKIDEKGTKRVSVCGIRIYKKWHSKNSVKSTWFVFILKKVREKYVVKYYLIGIRIWKKIFIDQFAKEFIQAINEQQSYNYNLKLLILSAYTLQKPFLRQPKFSSANELWRFVDSRKHIDMVYLKNWDYYKYIFAHSKDQFSWYSVQYPNPRTELHIMHGRTIQNGEMLHSLSRCIELNIPILFVERPFIYCIEPYRSGKLEQRFTIGCGVILSREAFYYDATVPSDIENELNSNYMYTPNELTRARKLIDKIVALKITKYNNQPLELKNELPTDIPIVLVVDQAVGDWSITKGYANADTFRQMLDAAISENPNAFILVKIHPDIINNPKRGKLDNCAMPLGNYSTYQVSYKDKDRVRFLSIYANPYSVIERCTKVYVCTSQFGFESLMAGKETHIFGSPFYAGWGLGKQRSESPAMQRRKRKHSIEEIFITSYINYSRYINPITRQRCELEELIEVLPMLRAEYLMKSQEISHSPKPARQIRSLL